MKKLAKQNMKIKAQQLEFRSNCDPCNVGTPDSLSVWSQDPLHPSNLSVKVFQESFMEYHINHNGITKGFLAEYNFKPISDKENEITFYLTSKPNGANPNIKLGVCIVNPCAWIIMADGNELHLNNCKSNADLIRIMKAIDICDTPLLLI